MFKIKSDRGIASANLEILMHSCIILIQIVCLLTINKPILEDQLKDVFIR